MTDKQIMIDGVDVSGCEFATKSEIACDTHCRLCDYEYCIGKDCHYKNWQRKEQECEELKKIIDEAKNSKLDLKSFLVGEAVQNEYEQQLDQLKAENENLKHILQTEFITVRAIGKEPVLLYKGYELDKLINYKQAIEKIKEIALSVTGHFPDGEIFARPEIEQILQICDEVTE